jgi:anti-anti-sigma regulatory factor
MALNRDRRPMSRSLVRAATQDGDYAPPAEAMRVPWRQAELAELERVLRSAMTGALMDAASQMLVASAQRRDGYTALALGGPVNGGSVPSIAAHIRGVLDSGARHLVIDLSRVAALDASLTALMRRVEARTAEQGCVFELTGLTPRVLHDMDDDPLARVFALYRAALEDASPRELSWARTRCPQGLEDVAEPHTAARHRTFF